MINIVSGDTYARALTQRAEDERPCAVGLERKTELAWRDWRELRATVRIRLIHCIKGTYFLLGRR